jgi:hypothetical protein
MLFSAVGTPGVLGDEKHWNNVAQVALRLLGKDRSMHM